MATRVLEQADGRKPRERGAEAAAAIVWTDTQHDTAQEEAVLAYWRGYEQGRADHIAEMYSWAEYFVASAPGATVKPLEEQYAAVVADLVARMTAERRRSA